MKHIEFFIIYILGTLLIMGGLIFVAIEITNKQRQESIYSPECVAPTSTQDSSILSVINAISEACPDTDELQACKLWEEAQKWRADQQKPFYKWNNDLCRWATVRNEEIKTDWSHDGFHVHKAGIWDDIHYTRLGENLATGYGDDETKMFTAWLNSPSHRDNLEEAYTDSCITTSDGYAVQLFATL